jgi:hypothetical protein
MEQAVALTERGHAVATSLSVCDVTDTIRSFGTVATAAPAAAAAAVATEAATAAAGGGGTAGEAWMVCVLVCVCHRRDGSHRMVCVPRSVRSVEWCGVVWSGVGRLLLDRWGVVWSGVGWCMA